VNDDVIRAAGAVLWRPLGDGAAEVALVHRPRYDDWTLPKGKLDPGETAAAAAVREVAEETGFRCWLGRRLGQARYEVRSSLARQTGPKTVDYWAARAADGAFTPSREVDALRWLRPAQARELLSYDYDRTVLDAFSSRPLPTATILLVRHAEAGERSAWHGDDDLRPLTPDGLHQADELNALLQLFGPTSVHSAPRLRCVQTVAPLASKLGVDVTEEPRFSEEGYEADPPAALERLLRLADAGGVAVVCSQGGVIPGLMYAVAGPAIIDEHGDIPSKKGSTWVLTVHGRDLLAADHYPPP
jgi:8-oxo-(d)GTP phosphatase